MSLFNSLVQDYCRTSISLNLYLVVPPYNAVFIHRSPSNLTPMSFWVFLLQKALFPPTWHHRMLFAIIHFLFFRTDSQNVKFLHWASIFIGNLPVTALHTLLLQYLFIPSSHFNIFFLQLFCGIIIYFPTTVNYAIWYYLDFQTF